MRKIAIFLFFLLLVSAALAHEEVVHNDALDELFHNVNDMDVTIIGTVLLLGIVAYAAVFKDQIKKENQKKRLFIIIIAITVGVTAYIGAETIYKNLKSETGGPVHWHADFEIWACGTEIIPHSPESVWDNKIGTPLLHHHDDKRIHVEGILRSRSEASLGAFFEAIGGELAATSVEIDGKRWQNGDLCNDQPGTLMMFVNGQQNFEFDDHVPAPYSNVPPGDRIKIVFDERPAQINRNIGVPP